MSVIEFKYKNNTITVQGKDEEKMKAIIDKFLVKGYGIKDNLIFLYDGEKVDEEMTLLQQANDIDKLNKKMSIIAVDFKDIDKNIKNLKKSKNIICPECYENIRIKIQGQKISLYDCRNKHKKDDILLNQFDKTQYIDETEIICNACKKITKIKYMKTNFIFALIVNLNYALYVKLVMTNHMILLIMMIKIIYVRLILNHILHIVMIVKKIYVQCVKKSI